MPGFIKGKEAREVTRGREVMKGRVDREAGWVERQGGKRGRIESEAGKWRNAGRI
jgi:hypothetical protein